MGWYQFFFFYWVSTQKESPFRSIDCFRSEKAISVVEGKTKNGESWRFFRDFMMIPNQSNTLKVIRIHVKTKKTRGTTVPDPPPPSM